LKDRIVLICGADSLLGQVVALRCEKEGAKIVKFSVDQKNESKSNDIASAVTGNPQESAAQTDLDKLYSTFIKEHGRIDVVVNCFAPPISKTLLDTSEVSLQMHIYIFLTNSYLF